MRKIYRKSGSRFDVFEDDAFVGWMEFHPQSSVESVSLFYPVEVAYSEDGKIIRHIVNGYNFRELSLEEVWEDRRNKYVPDYGV